MNKVFSLMFSIFTLFSSSVVFAADTPVACGPSNRCEDGYYCTGSIGDTKSGVCVINSVNISMCRFTEYLQSDIVKYLMVFASIFAGIYFFLGKFELKTFATIIVGIGILLGASNLIAQLTGSSKGLCNKKAAEKCVLNVTGNKKHSNSTVIYNLDDKISPDSRYTTNSQIGKKCGILGCIQSFCQSYEYKPKTDTTPASCELGKSSVKVFVLEESTKGSFTPGNCPTSFKITCNPVGSQNVRDYFQCKNECTGVEFGAEAPSIWKIANCQDLVNKNVNYSK